MHTDPIADLLTRIRNAIKAHHEVVRIPYSRLKENIVIIMKNYKFIDGYQVNEESKFRELVVMLKEGTKDLTFKRVSKPGQRIYIKKEDLKPVKRGLGISIISTSKGLMTNSEANKQKLGGELICQIY